MMEALSMYKEARAPRDYKREYAQYHSKQEQIDRRSTRNKARRKLGLKKGDPREVDHKIPLSKGGGNGKGNLRAVSLVENRKKFTKTATAPHHTYVSQLTNLSSKKQKRLLAKEKKNEQKYGRKDFWKDPRYRAEMEMKHKKLFPSKTSWKQLTDSDFAKITKQYKKCRTDRDKHTAMMQELRKLGLPKDVWREKVRAPAGTWSKTAAYRPRVDSIIYKRENGKLKVLAAKDDTLAAQGIGFQSSPYSFPGGGVEPDQDPISAAQMEAMEEAGVMGKNFKLISSKPKRINLDKNWRDRQYKKRGQKFKGVYNYSVIGEYDQSNDSILGRDDDAWDFSWYPAEDVVNSLKKDKGQFRSANKVNAKALQSLLSKTAGNPRIPRKPGQPAKSDKHSDLFTDEDPKGTIHGLGFKTPALAKKSVAKIKGSGKTHAHKTQAAIAMEQRARSMGKTQAANVYRAFIEEQKKKTRNKK